MARPRLGPTDAEAMWNEVRAAVAGARRHELRSGSRRSTACSGPATTSSIPARCSCTRGCGSARSTARARRSRSSTHALPVDELNDEFPLRLTTGRRLAEYNTGVQTGSYASPTRRGETIDVSPGGRDAHRPQRRAERARPIAPRRGGRAGAHRRGAATRPDVHDVPFPGRCGDQHADHRRGRIRKSAPRSSRPRRSASRPSDADPGRIRVGCASPITSVMDLHIVGAEPTEAERAGGRSHCWARRISGWEGGARDMRRATAAPARRRTRSVAGERDLLLPALHAVQDGIGWISHGALNYICKRLSVPPAEAWGVVTFYHLLATEPRRRPSRTSATTSPAGLHGAEQLCRDRARARAWAGRRARRPRSLRRAGSAVRAWASATARRRRFVAAGRRRAARGPSASARVTRGARSRTTARRALAAIRLARTGSERSVPWRATRLELLRRIGRVDPSSLDAYRASGGYRALTRAVEMGPDRVIAEVTASKLMGRGGAAFPTGRKWEAVARESAPPHYVVCNADESEPGTFKDRVLMEGDPFAIIEAMTICGIATGCGARLHLHSRRVSRAPSARIGHAIAQALAAGLLGAERRPVGGLRFDIEIRRGGGAYICGEETALFNSIEGKRGEPRSKPPFPAQSGLFGKPTVVNNVETLVNVLDIVHRRRRGVGAGRHAGVDRHAAVLPVGPHRAARALRDRRSGATLARSDRAGRRRPQRPRAAGDPARRGRRDVRWSVGARHAAVVRRRARAERDARLRRDHGVRRDGRPARHAGPHRGVLQARIVRPMRALPGRARCGSGALEQRCRGAAIRDAAGCRD